MKRFAAIALFICVSTMGWIYSTHPQQDDTLSEEEVVVGEDEELDDLVVDRDRDRGRDERRNLYEVNRDNVKREAHERARYRKKHPDDEGWQQREYHDEETQRQQPYYDYYPQ